MTRYFRGSLPICAIILALALRTVSIGHTSPAPPTLTVDKYFGKVAGWSIGISNSLGGCVAAATYDDDTTIWFGFGGIQNTSYLAFTNPKWRSIDIGQTYEIVIHARDQGRWHGSFVGFDRNGSRGLFTSSLKDKFITDLSNSGELAVEYKGHRFTDISLVGSTEALAAVAECQKGMTGNTAEGSGSPGSDRASRSSPEDEHSSQGTGFYVSSKGHVLTNNHVIKGCATITVTNGDAPAIAAHLIANDAQNDLALLGTGLAQATVPHLSTRPRVGESVYVFGYPLNGILATTGNFTIGNITATAGLGDDTRQLQISAPVQPGNSGGPLVDKYGDVVGVIVSKLNALKMASITSDLAQNVNFAIKAVIAQNFLDANGIDTSSPSSQEEAMDSETIANKVKQFTVRVNCH